MMGDLTLNGRLNLAGSLTLKDKVLVETAEALVELTPTPGQGHGQAPPVNLPPPPVGPADPGLDVTIVNSFNKTVKAGTKPIVALGMVMQGDLSPPLWPGMVLLSTVNTTVTINHVAINVVGDSAVIFPSGGSASLSTSGQ
jgi:hypothetical protein